MNIRKERIERLLQELQYEVTRGIMEREVEEELVFRFVVPISNKVKEGVIVCEFRTTPRHRSLVGPSDLTPRLRLALPQTRRRF